MVRRDPDPDVVSDPPPSYNEATGTGSSSASSRPQPTSANSEPAPAIPRKPRPDNRRLPKGWVRQFDERNNRDFFVDTTKDPPRSIWVHPFEDKDYLATLSSEEREAIEQETITRDEKKKPHSKEDIKSDMIDADSDDEDDHHPHQRHTTTTPAGPSYTTKPSSSSSAPLPPRTAAPQKKSFGRKLKDKVTGTTHEQRVQIRHERAEHERRLYQQQREFDDAMFRAVQTGQPQHLGRDETGRDIYVSPPMPPTAYGYDPYYGNGGVRDTPQGRYIIPPSGYSRGGGYGGGFGGSAAPLALGLGGGLLGGLLLADIMF